MFGERGVACVWRKGSNLCLERGKKPAFGEREVACVWREGSSFVEER